MTLPSPAANREDTVELTDFLTRKGQVQLLDVFLSKGSMPLTSDQLQDFTGLHQSTVSRRLEDLVAAGLIEKNTEAWPRQYRLDRDHAGVEGLREAHLELHAHVDEIQAASEEYDPESEDYQDGSPFTELFRYPSNAKLLSALLEHPDSELRPSELANAADVHRSTVSDNIELLKTVGLVEEVDRPWNDSLEYTLNQGHPATDGFSQAIEDLELQESGQEAFPEGMLDEAVATDRESGQDEFPQTGLGAAVAISKEFQEELENKLGSNPVEETTDGPVEASDGAESDDPVQDRRESYRFQQLADSADEPAGEPDPDEDQNLFDEEELATFGDSALKGGEYKRRSERAREIGSEAQIPA